MRADKLPLVMKRKEPKKKEMTPSQRKKLGMQSSQVSSGFDSSPQDLEESDGISLEHLVRSAERFRRQGLNEIGEQWGSPEEKLQQLPEAVQPAELEAKLLPYQLQVNHTSPAFSFCLSHIVLTADFMSGSSLDA